MATFRLPSPSSNYPSQFLYLHSCPSLFFFSLLLLSLFLTSATSLTVSSLVNPHSFTSPRITYSDQCNHIVPESPIDPSPSAAFSRASLAFNVGFFSGGDSFNRSQSRNGDINSARFRPKSIRKTLGSGKIYKVEARLTLQISRTSASSSNYGGDLGQGKLQVTQIEGRRIPVNPWGGASFDFSGFWSESTGQVCMIGSTQVLSAEGTYKSFDARLLLNYTKDSNIYGSLVKGVLEMVNNQSDFRTITILGARNTPLNYEYKLLEESKSDCGADSEESFSLESVLGGMCKVFGSISHTFALMYRADCGINHRCSPLGSDVEYAPCFMSLLSFPCEGEKMRMLLSFSNESSLSRSFPFDPSTTLVAEGAWDVEKNRFCGVACRILNFSDSLSNAVVGDCSLRLSLRFSAVLSIKNMSPVVGEIWSGKAESDPSYFRRIKFSSLNIPLWRFPGLRYEYTESERVSKLCGTRKSHPKSKGKTYPDALTPDMIFVMSVKDSGGGNVLRSARASPKFVGDRLIPGQAVGLTGVPMNVNSVTKSFTNITYRIRFLSPVSESRGDIYAEGTYDRDTGELCMVGCQSVRVRSTVAMLNQAVDCSLAIKIKFSPIDSNSDDRLKGTIESTREKTDPLYVGRMEVLSRSIYVHQAKESVWRMDLEVAMVLISNTLSCLFVGMQLYHMKKHQEALPFISIAMLILLTLGHMIPLLLNFEELFNSRHNQQSLFFENDRWLEAKEIVVRIVTMIAFLLECRLLQLAWTARKTEDHHHRQGVSNAEKKVAYVCLPLYITGGLIAWLVNRNRTPKRMVYIGKPRTRNLLYRPVTLKRSFQRPSLWKDLKSYGGLMLDAFLLPQILFNGFSNSDSKSLAASFYGGNSIIRLLPHAYDLYRSRSYGKILDWSYIYANHKMDYYSTAWDIIILCIGFLFAFLIFLQQRFGGRCFIPKRFRDNVGYEKVVELQETGELHNTSDS
uniref:RING-type E3 ubiquitin transferase n=1 Tax=Noccaea caerulescens TaxID=107243 RepID=A0A1J3JRP8_NOCCA